MSGLIQQIYTVYIYIKLKSLRIKSQICTLHFCSVMFRLGVSPLWCYRLFTLAEQLFADLWFHCIQDKSVNAPPGAAHSIFYKDRCVFSGVLQKELDLKHEDFREHPGKCWLSVENKGCDGNEWNFRFLYQSFVRLKTPLTLTLTR